MPCPKYLQRNGPEAESQKRVWICMDLYGSVRISFSSANSGSHTKIQNIDFYICIQMLEFLQLLVYIMGISNNVIKAVDDGDDSSY